MGVTRSKIFDDGYTPMCNGCGVALCWDISSFDYEKEKQFWDNWECKECNPEAEGQRKRWRESQEKV